METVTFYPAPEANDGTNKAEWTPTLPLKAGEYDLVNISLIGYDPNSGWTFDRCQAAWRTALKAAQIEEKTIRWWDIPARLRFNRKVAALAQRQGLMGF